MHSPAACAHRTASSSSPSLGQASVGSEWQYLPPATQTWTMDLPVDAQDKSMPAEFRRQFETSQIILQAFINNVILEDPASNVADVHNANGNFKLDVAVARKQLINGSVSSFHACTYIYGLQFSDLELCSFEHNQDACAIGPRYSDKQHSLFSDENLIAILNARGTVVLNPLFYGHSEAKAVVKLAGAAMQMFREVTDYSGLENAKVLLRYKLILPVIREDVHLHMLGLVDKFPPAFSSRYKNSRTLLWNRIHAWRAMFMDCHFSRLYAVNVHDRVQASAAMQRFMVVFQMEIEQMMENVDISFLEIVAAGKHVLQDLEVNNRSEYMGGPLAYDKHMETKRVLFPGLQLNAQGTWLDTTGPNEL